MRREPLIPGPAVVQTGEAAPSWPGQARRARPSTRLSRRSVKTNKSFTKIRIYAMLNPVQPKNPALWGIASDGDGQFIQNRLNALKSLDSVSSLAFFGFLLFSFVFFYFRRGAFYFL
jgi:hypothetical protein